MERALLFGCMHFPLADAKAVSEILDCIAHWKPDHIVNLGDGIEADALSKHPSELTFDLLDEYDAYNKFLVDVRKAAPTHAKLHCCEGNHEERNERRGSGNRKTRRVTALRRNVPELEYWRWYPYVNNDESCVRIGQLTGLHGFSVSKNSDHNEAVRFGIQYGLTVRAHTHKPTPPLQATIHSARVSSWCANVGTGCDIERYKAEHYARTIDTNGWGFQPILWEGNTKRRAFNSRQWEAVPALTALRVARSQPLAAAQDT